MNASPKQSSMPAKLDRYELKFTISESLAVEIASFAEIYCAPDKYSYNSPDGYYTVNNLYLDTPRLLFLRQRLEGCEKRFNMRIRGYGDSPVLPYFLETKEKRMGIIRKSRGVVISKDWSDRLENYQSPAAPDANSDIQNSRFTDRIQIYQASPRVRTQYKRMAFVSQIDEYGRLTLDRQLKCASEERYRFTSDDSNLNAYDSEILFDPGSCIILELKCFAQQVPIWMTDLIRRFDLRRRSFSKYASSMANILEKDGYSSGNRMPVQFL